MVHNEIVTVVLGPTVDVAAGTGAKWGQKVGVVGEKYEILSADLFPDVGITFNAANFSTYTFRNETQAVDIGVRAYSAVSSVAQTPESIPLTAANKFVNGGDVLSWAKAESGTGLAGRPRCTVRLRRIS